MLSQTHCIPCEGGVKPLTRQEIDTYLSTVSGWEVVKDEKAIEKKFIFKNFTDALSFVNRVAKIAEEEQHHPDIFLHGWNKVDIMLSTHAIGGISQNDFILAAKINTL